MTQLLQKFGGAGRNRTDDILLAKQALYQLSYGPKPLELVGLGGLEPPTSRLSSARSNQLSYKPKQPFSAIALLGCQKACFVILEERETKTAMLSALETQN
jgi:hypothetical protein